MIDPKKMLDDLLAAPVPGTQGSVGSTANEAVRLAKQNPIATGAIALALLGTGPGRALAGTVLRMGGLAAVAGLAYTAFQKYRQGEAGSASTTDEPVLLPPGGSVFDPAAAPQGEDNLAFDVIRAMITAANADGHIDEEERQRIAGRMEAAGLDQEAAAFIQAELATPRSLDDVAASARSDPQKVELYTASRIVLQPDKEVEREYLRQLAEKLGLPGALVEQIEATVSSVRA